MTTAIVSAMIKLLTTSILDADSFLYNGQFEKSYKILTSIISILDRFDEYPELDHYKGHIFERTGRLLLEWKVYNASLLMFIKALDRYSLQDDILGQVCAYGNIGMCYQALGDKFKAIEYYLEHVILSSRLQHIEPDKLEYMDFTTPVNRLTIKYLTTALNISQAIEEKLGLINHRNRLNWFSQVKENCIKALEMCKYPQPVSVFKQMSSFSTESNLIARLRSLHDSYTDSFTRGSYLGNFLQVSTLSKINSNFFLEAVSASNIAHTSLYIGDFSKAIEFANSAISLFLSYRHTCTLDQLPASFEVEERKAYAWLILAQVKNNLLFDALLSCEKHRYQMLAGITHNHGYSQLEFHLLDVNKLKVILDSLKLTTLYYHVIQFEDLEPQLIIWLVQPQPSLSSLSLKKDTKIDIRCHIVDLPSFSIGDIREWVSQCRYALEFSCCSDTIDRIQPTSLSVSHNASSTLYVELADTNTSNRSCIDFPASIASSDQGVGPLPSSLRRTPSTSSLDSMTTQITHHLSSPPTSDNAAESLPSTSTSSSSSSLTLFLHSMLLVAAGGLLFLFSPLILFIESFRLFLVIFISVTNNQLRPCLKILRTIYDHLHVQQDCDTPSLPKYRQFPVPPSLLTLLAPFFGATSTTDVIHKLYSKYLSRQTTVNNRKCDNTATNACQSMYDVLFMVFESELSGYEEGLDLAIVTHDVLGLVPFSALMDSKGIYLINKYKLRRIPSIFLTWDLHSNQLAKTRQSSSSSSGSRRRRQGSSSNAYETIINESSYHYDHDDADTDRLVGGRGGGGVGVPVDSSAGRGDQTQTQTQREGSVSSLTQAGTTSTASTVPTGNQRYAVHSPVRREPDIEVTSLNQYLFDRGVLQLASAKRRAVKVAVLNLSPEAKRGVGTPVAHSYGDSSSTGTSEIDSQPTGSGPGRCPPTVWNAADVYRLFMEASEQRPDVVILRSCYRPDQRGGGASFEWLDGIVRALHCSGVPCVIFAITELCDSSTLPILNHFYHALLGVVELDIASDTAPLDSIEALQAAVFRLMFTGDNYANPRRWSGLVFSGIPVDMRGRTR